jgi:Na+-translocating ferredoxin:NAD+ oxidoreductase RnfD subunit
MSTDPNGRPAGAPPKAGGGFDRFKPFLAPLLITSILALGEYQYGILEGKSLLLNNTAWAILTAIAAEVLLRRLAAGKWPHWILLASAYITGISVGILLRTHSAWPYVVCSLLSISSKYALRVKGRHIWNPSNLGVTVLLLLVPDAVAPLSQQWGNQIWVPLIIMALGSLILYALGRLHITLTYAVTFAALSLLRSALTDELFINEIAVLTAPSYLLFMFFMITDPKTTTRTRTRQCAVAVVVALADTALRLFSGGVPFLAKIHADIHAPYYALFVVAPVTNLLEIWWDGRQAPRPAPTAPAPAPAVPDTAVAAGRPLA